MQNHTASIVYNEAGLSLFAIILVVAVILAVVVVVFLAVYMPYKHGVKGRRVFEAELKRHADITLAEGTPLVFTTKKRYFAAMVYVMTVLGFMAVWFAVHSGLLLENTLVALGLMFLLSALVGIMLLLITQYCARLYIYPNKIVCQGFFRTKAFYYSDLDLLRLGVTYGRYAAYDAYEFRRDDQRVLRLSVLVFKNLFFLETIFTEEHPYVANITRISSPAPDIAAKV